MSNISEMVKSIPVCLETKSSKMLKIEKPIFWETHQRPDKDLEIPKEENVKQQDNDEQFSMMNPRLLYHRSQIFSINQNKFKTVM